MQKYKIKLMPEDHVRTRGLSISDFENLVSRFFQDGCAEGDYNTKKFHDYDWIGWGMNGIKFCDNSLVFEGRELSFSEVMELAEPQKESSWYERGELPPVGLTVKLVCNKTDNKFLNSISGKEVEIVMHTLCSDGEEKTAVFRWNEGKGFRYHAMVKGWFEPIKSDREKAIEASFSFARNPNNPENVKDFLGRIYDAGLLCAPEEK